MQYLNKNYHTITQHTPNNAYYPVAIPPDPLERYGSGHLDLDVLGTFVSRLTLIQQMDFVRRVLAITTAQCVAISSIVFFIVHICPLFEWLNDRWAWWIPVIPLSIISLLIMWQLYSQFFHLSLSTRTVLLSIYSACVSLVLANVIAKFMYEEGQSILIMTIFGLTCCILYTLQKRYPFSGAFPFVCSLGAICLTSLWLRYIYEMDPIEILLPITAASLICIYIILELYYMMHNVTLEDYMLANLNLFIDIIYPIRFIHHFCELTDHLNMFPDVLYPGE
ncbi:Transmembrane BAX inhibitor motif-containing protein 4 [Choanephora cucurbitarum]|uniref:Transmembrane BAX inhibitor motif-containing protein 4 n=1 Tax=Choanephora cucurbitarum TaxID=101091 RepID=A0A1C7N6R0_9FUNG|nr:Transmembrane BAX inhibitor motif-containing protein 4 [Choanephora cucurbitarum]